MNFKTLTVSTISFAALALGAFVTPSQARDGHINGYTVNVVESGSYSAPDFITVYGPEGKEQITVTCAPFDWSSYGSNSADFVEDIASEWCF